MQYESVLIERFLASASPDDDTWREWIADVLIRLEGETDSFCGKRPRGDSDWWWHLAAALAMIDPKIATTGTVYDEDGLLDSFVPDHKRVAGAWRAVIWHMMGVRS